MTEEMVTMLVSTTSELGVHIAIRYGRLAATPDIVRATHVLAITDPSRPDEYDIVIAQSSPLDVDGSPVLFVKDGVESFRSVVLTSNPSNFIFVTAAVGPVTERELWEQVQAGRITPWMERQVTR